MSCVALCGIVFVVENEVSTYNWRPTKFVCKNNLRKIDKNVRSSGTGGQVWHKKVKLCCLVYTFIECAAMNYFIINLRRLYNSFEVNCDWSAYVKISEANELSHRDRRVECLFFLLLWELVKGTSVLWNVIAVFFLAVCLFLWCKLLIELWHIYVIPWQY